MTLPPSSLQDVFISYGRADSKDFSRRLKDRLTEAGLGVWFDFDDIPLGVDYQNQIDDAIEKADNILFVISPHSVNSPYCTKELELALARNKRIIPLLHVESISYETWQQRHPDAPAEDWALYQEKGLHSSYPNMHPEIGKINWVYFRAGLDDFEASLAGLLATLDRQRGYVHQHTELLVKARDWEQHQRQSSYLLTAAELKAAEQWLHQRFRDEQPPCIPTDLHCEFITESLKAANDRFTQVFLSYSEEDMEVQEKIRRQLVRAGLTVWVNTQDIRTADDFQAAINQGIEKTDNIVLLLSPNSLASQYCQQELSYARRYHKRIVPLLVTAMDLAQLPDDLRTVQFVDFSALGSEQHFGQAIDELLRTLREDAAYVNDHKRLLVKALAWERQGRDRKFLLRGSEFAQAQDWLAKAPPPGISPTDLHGTFIQASQGARQFYDIFVSYGRADSKVFAADLCERLNAQGYQVWFDKNDIPLGVDFQEQINSGIEKSHSFVFIISPHAVNSPYCAKEIELALAYRKQILPVLHVEEIGYETWQQRFPNGTPEEWQAYQEQGKHSSFPNMHPEIGKINWINGDGQQGLDEIVEGLVALSQRHGNYVQQHTELLTKALAWDRHQRQPSYLLTGEDRIRSQNWLTQEFETEQAPCYPTLLQTEFVTDSLKVADGGMTQVFISYAEENSEVKEMVRKSLLRSGITVWTNTTDIQTGEDFESAINRGIAEANSVVYLISQAAIESVYCQQEITLARSYNKRIIPILIEEIDLGQLDDALRRIQFIKFTDSQTDADREQDLAELLRTVRQEATYYEQHKRLLVRALKWQRQKKNPSLLLRPQEQQSYLGWVQNARQHSLNPVLPLQLEFLEASEQQPPDQTIGVFLIHHVDDSDFSRRLNETLLVQGKSTWFTPEGTAGEADILAEAQRALDNAENVLIVLSPSLVRCGACLQRLAYAREQQKRILLVVYRDVVRSTLPLELGGLAWSDFRRNEGDFLTNFGELFRTLESDPDHVRTHTRLLVKASEWDDAQRDDSYLLRGSDMEASVEWLSQASDKTPTPSDIHREYIQASQALPFKRIRLRSVALATVATTLALSAVRLLGLLQPLEAIAYDHLLRLRPHSGAQDERMLIVEVDSDSGEWLRDQTINGPYEPGLGTIPDQALGETIEVLNRHGARLIGLDFFRDFPASGELAPILSQTENLYSICQTAGQEGADDIASELPQPRVGFANLLYDGGVVRRHYLTQWPGDSSCASEDAFSLLLAQAYLETEGVAYENTSSDELVGDIFIGDEVIPNIWPAGAFYNFVNMGLWNWSSLDDYQTLLNYRTYPPGPEPERDAAAGLKNFAERVSLEAIIRDQVPPDLIRDRIVLIGYTDFSDRETDSSDTPYGADIPGVYLHGQMLSQLINVALEDRPLISWWSFEGETVWILLWSAVGGAVFWRCLRSRSLLVASLSSVGILSLACYGFMVGPVIWVPWVPALAGWGIAGGAVGYMTYRLRKG